MISVSLLNPQKDKSHFETVWKWQFEKSAWWQKMYAVWEKDFDGFFQKASRLNELSFGIFDREKLIGFFTLEELSRGVFNVHVETDRTKISYEKLFEAVFILRRHISEKGGAKIVTCIASINKPLKRFALNVGFVKTNGKVLRGNFKNKILEWEEYFLIIP